MPLGETMAGQQNLRRPNTVLGRSVLIGRSSGLLKSVVGGALLAMLPSTLMAAPLDRDEDGWLRFADCNDRDDTIYPGAPELEDGKDNDCDFIIDEGPVPHVSIVSPSVDGAVVAVDGFVMEAVVTSDQSFADLTFDLTSDGGTPSNVSVRFVEGDETVEISGDLPCGAQTLTLTVTDTDGDEGSDTAIVEADEPPIAAVVSPSDGDVFGEGFLVDLNGLATDRCNDSQSLEVTWLDNGELVFSGFANADGTTSFTLDDLAGGSHLLTLNVVDGNGQSDSDAVFITVMEGETCSIADDLLVHYNFEEGVGTELLDASGNGNIAEVYGDASWTSSFSAGAGLALSFDGVDDFAVAPHADVLSATDEVTLSFWMRMDSLPPVFEPNVKNWYPVVSKGEADQFQTERNYSMYVTSTEAAHFSMSLPDGSGSTNPTESSSQLSVGEWIHVTGRGSINNGGTVTYYFNGQRDRVFTNRGNTALLANSQPLFLGKTLESNPFFHGAIDDLRVYGCALSDAQIETLFESAP